MPSQGEFQVARSARPQKNRLLHRILQADPGQEYLLYTPSSAGAEPPLVVSVHGVSRNAHEHARLLSAYSEMYGTILVVPFFSEEQHRDYQRLGRIGQGKRADLALNMILADVAQVSGWAAEQFYLFGFSGGAQFAHRYAMAHPHRVASAVFAAAGWYTMPSPNRRFPYGTRPSKKLPGLIFDAEEFLCVPMTVLVGVDDTGSSGLRRGERLDREQGTNRVERAHSFVAAMKESAGAHHLESLVNCIEIPNCDHSFRRSILRGGLGDKVFEILFGAPLVNSAAIEG
ncbi:MAG: hypothetical protein GY725_12515 [bacterium]|nr:hypothetical protein [bacterium]